MSQSPKEIRQARGLPRIVVAVRAGVSEPLVRLYEEAPRAIKNDQKRAALDGVYAQLADGH